MQLRPASPRRRRRAGADLDVPLPGLPAPDRQRVRDPGAVPAGAGPDPGSPHRLPPRVRRGGSRRGLLVLPRLRRDGLLPHRRRSDSRPDRRVRRAVLSAAQGVGLGSAPASVGRGAGERRRALRVMDLGLVTFADLAPGQPPAERMQNLLEEARRADDLGLKVFAVGEHHRPDYLISSPATVLAAIAAQTTQIRLSSAVTVLSSDDPVRVFQQFAHVDLISGGRAEIMAGRGSFTESFPLFGYDLRDYDELFSEKLELLLAIRDSARVPLGARRLAAGAGGGPPRRPARRCGRLAAAGAGPAARLGRRRRDARV